MGAKMRLREALKLGELEVALDAAATMVQGAWRSKVARRKVATLMLAHRHLQSEIMEKKLALEELQGVRAADKKVVTKKPKLVDEVQIYINSYLYYLFIHITFIAYNNFET